MLGSFKSVYESAWCYNYRELARELNKIDSRFRPSDICASLERGSENIVSIMQHTCKDHKPDGQVAFRSIHACGSHSFEGISKAIAIILDKQLCELNTFVEAPMMISNALEAKCSLKAAL